MRRTTKLLFAPALAALTAGAVLTAALPAQGADAACEPGSLELVGAPAGSITSGSDHVQGYLLRRLGPSGSQCVAAGVTVELLARDAGQQVTRVVRSALTDADGRVQFRVRPPYTVVLSARSSPTERHPSARSATALVVVGTRLGFAVRTVDRCRVAVSGRTYPAKPGTTVEVFRSNDRDGRVRLGAPRVATDGSYASTLAIPCGNRDPLQATIQRTARNGVGGSGLPRPVATSLMTCGEAGPSDPRTAALAHRFDPYNTVTAVDGSWWGERVITNTSSEPLSFDRYTGGAYRLMRLGTRTVLGGPEGTDAFTATPVTLQPGEAVRETVALRTRNCYEPIRGIVAEHGPPFPAGTRLVGQTVLSTSLGTSTGQRVELRVE